MHVYFRAADAIQAFLDSIQGNRALADQDTRDELIDRINAYGTIEDMVTRRRSSRPSVRSVSRNDVRVASSKGVILLIDDDTVIRNSLERYLRSNKLKVDQAKNGALALEHVIRSQDEFDLIIVDLHMPIMDGFEFVTELKQFPPTTIFQSSCSPRHFIWPTLEKPPHSASRATSLSGVENCTPCGNEAHYGNRRSRRDPGTCLSSLLRQF